MTNEELYKLFRESYPEVQVVDYRPADPVFVKGKVGITIWTSFGDVILFFPRLDNNLRMILNQIRKESDIVAIDTTVSKELFEKYAK